MFYKFHTFLAPIILKNFANITKMENRTIIAENSLNDTCFAIPVTACDDLNL